MNETDIANALGQRLAMVPTIATVIFENRDAMPALPYIWAEIVPTSRLDRSMVGGSAISRGFMIATIIAPLNKFATPARAMADLIIARFPARLILPIAGGKVIIGDVEPLQGYPDAVAWRQPVRINYTATRA